MARAGRHLKLPFEWALKGPVFFLVPEEAKESPG